MKGMKGRILKKLKSIPQVPYLKQGPILLFDHSSPSSPFQSSCQILSNFPNSGLDSIEEEEEGDPKPAKKFNEHTSVLEENKENIRPSQSEGTECSFRRPNPNSATLFDPSLLVAFHQAVMEHYRNLEQSKITIREEREEEEEPPWNVPRTSSSEERDPLVEFEDRCPPNGREVIVLYTTSLRGIRKTFEDCSRIRLLLENMKLVFVERDMSMHNEFREELWRVLGFRAIPPRLFVKGRYIGGADEVIGLHEQGRLMPLVKGMARNREGRNACEGCGGMRFKVCCECNGGKKQYVNEGERIVLQCRECNENGLVVCSLCC